jgi:hypothetical protein
VLAADRDRPGLLGHAASLTIAHLLCVSTGLAQPETKATPPVDVEGLTTSAPSPTYDLGLLLGVSGVGKQEVWQGTDFSLGLIFDVLFLRKHARSLGLGAYGALQTSGFFDTRASLGPTVTCPLSELFQAQLRIGPSLLGSGEGAQLGFDADLEIGVRGLSQSGHYSMTHALALGVQHYPGPLPRAGTALLINLRLDAFWLLLPVALLR